MNIKEKSKLIHSFFGNALFLEKPVSCLIKTQNITCNINSSLVEYLIGQDSLLKLTYENTEIEFDIANAEIEIENTHETDEDIDDIMTCAIDNMTVCFMM